MYSLGQFPSDINSLLKKTKNTDTYKGTMTLVQTDDAHMYHPNDTEAPPFKKQSLLTYDFHAPKDEESMIPKSNTPCYLR
jgi:hypothetical protein